jgi:hypothetical protein
LYCYIWTLTTNIVYPALVLFVQSNCIDTGRLYIVAYIIIILLDAMAVVGVVCVVVAVVVVAIFAKMNNE